MPPSFRSLHRCLVALLVVLVSWRPLPAQPPDWTPPPPEADAVRIALGELGIDAREVMPDPMRTLLPGRRPPAAATTVRALLDPLGAPGRLGMLEEQFRRTAQESPHRLAVLVLGVWDAEIARGFLGNPFAATDAVFTAPDADPLALAARRLDEAAGAAPGSTVVPSAEALPDPWRREVARLLFALASAEEFRRAAFPADVEWPESPRTVHEALEGVQKPGANALRRRLPVLAARLDREALGAGWLDLMAAAEDFMAWAPSAPVDDVEVAFDTPLGRVIVSTGGADEARVLSDVLLLIDRAGNDRYRADTTSQSLALVLDVAGDDTYVDNGLVGIAGAFRGIRVQWDGAGNDRHVGAGLGQGMGLFGLAALVDESGDDFYEGNLFNQGAGVVGAGLLLDRAGNDRYDARTRSQASGDAAGAGVLVDLAGDDTYLMNDPEGFVISAQSEMFSTAAGQGCGIGRRGDLSDGFSMPGGVGLLIDAAGDDRYEAGVYAQGAGYLGGTGLLADSGGDDHYKGGYYAQGAAAHRAVGGLLDRAGNDRYEVHQQVALGGAHDYSAAFAFDLGGNDDYRIERLGLGAAHENGTGFFLDAAGNDRYEVTAADRQALGAARVQRWGGPREAALGLGLFLDLGGEDTYPKGTGGDGSRWRGERKYPAVAPRAELGLGIDGDFPLPMRLRAMTPVPDFDRRELEGVLRARRAFRGGS